jgi:hypothetical protein
MYARIALGLALFLVAAGLVYGITSKEYIGASLLLIAAAGFAFMGLVIRRAMRASAAGEHEGEEVEPHVGPTIWPFVLSLAAVVVGMGTIITPWLIVVGAAILAVAAVGWFADVGRQWEHSDRAH